MGPKTGKCLAVLYSYTMHGAKTGKVCANIYKPKKKEGWGAGLQSSARIGSPRRMR